ncbi:MAG: hypothetical protein OXI55_03270 [Gammaproteobacteria bacterium]|nr:hypothetical protein [Gammaproteobacteria bacterium]
MSIAALVNQTIDRTPAGRIFGYEVFPQYREAPGAVVRAVNRGVASRRLARVGKGRFYKPRRGVLGDLPVSDEERLRDVLYRNGRRTGYVTGPALYNRLGLTTQMPRTVAVAVNRATQIKDLGTMRMRLLSRRAPISDSTVPLLEILDVLRDARKVPDANVERVIEAMRRRLADLAPTELKRLQRLALDYYSPSTRALLGMLLTRCRKDLLPELNASLNPTTRFDLSIDSDEWPESRAWNIR